MKVIKENNFIEVEYEPKYCVIKIKNDIVPLSTSIELKELFKKLFDEKKYFNYLLDLSELKFIESSLIGVIVEAFRTISLSNGKLALVIKSQAVYDRFEISQLDKVLRIYENIEDAIKTFK